MIELVNLSKTFMSKDHQVEALKDINLTINDGEIFGLIGFSGAGKSTLVRCINLLERPNSGNVLINGTDITKMSDKELRSIRKNIGMIFQHFNLMTSRTVFDNIALPLKKSGLSKQEITDKVSNLIRLVELEGKEKAYPNQLSGGQKQRVAIARALANDPQILLCDEATSALDPQTTNSILKLLKRVNKELGITIVIITHEMAVIKEICHRVGIMEDGRVKEMGNVIDIFANPTEQITKNFIATTTNITKIYDLIEDQASITKLEPGQTMCLLSYSTLNTNEAMISHISRAFNVNANVIFGNIEVIQNEPLGKLVVIFDGDHSEVLKAIDYMKERNVKVEVITTC